MNGFDFIKILQETKKQWLLHSFSLNYINLFPVPDGDTANNLLSALATDLRPVKHLGLMVKKIGKGHVGNGCAGRLFGEYLRGWAPVLGSHERAAAPDILKAMQSGVANMYRATGQVVEGTMLTVARKAAEAGANTERNMHDMLTSAFKAAVKVFNEGGPAVVEVPFANSGEEKLEFRKPVDSGSWGFLLFLATVLEVMGVGLPTRVDKPPYISLPGHKNGKLAHKYELQFTLNLKRGGYDEDHEGRLVLDGETLPADDNWYEAAAPLNALSFARVQDHISSLLVSFYRERELYYIHLHTDNPDRVLEEVKKLGAVGGVTIDNMSK